MKIVYLQTNGETSGPFTVEEVRTDLNAGRIPGDTPAYCGVFRMDYVN